ncbi:hypothetical protein QKV95_gp090 [Poseidoniales virus YSH_150918]|uniref:Uncharacterized protein n=1 Tax=Poseidoniales virus YSH_150918 TaxID=3071324 RepID=A0A976UB08_9CAUD|nr:hypothetical protein QKV95_gp090 [Yangshan Harbor Poseidoniales virus]UVF62567.1 hypothetical protein [Poseidoniales virus YSH_150918]
MTILFIGVVSGANVFFYAKFGLDFPYTILSHSILFGLITVGSIMCLKAIFDVSLNDRIEMYLLDQRIKAYWERKNKEEQQKNKIRETMKNQNYITPPRLETDQNAVSNEFLAQLQ